MSKFYMVSADMGKKEQFEAVGEGLLIRAPAKINLSLLVNGKRPDGFHEIETIMAKVSLYDELLIAPADEKGIELICKGPYPAPQGRENLVYKAGELLMGRFGLERGVRITLTKEIPAGAGLGGASSDAAAALLGLKRLFGLQIDKRLLFELAEELGSDIPFFLGGPLAFCKGRGQKITKLGEIFNFDALLILPDINVSTKRVYENYRYNKAEYKAFQVRINSFLEKNRIDLAARLCANMLLPSCFELYKELGELKKRIEKLGIRPLGLSGSGAGMFFIDFEREKLIKNKHKLEQEIGCESIIVSNNRW